MAAGAKAADSQNGKENCGNGMMTHFDGIYAAPIDRLGPAGRWVRHFLLDAILASSNLVTNLQAARRPWLDKLMRFLSFLGTEEFYTPIVVLLEWVIDTRLARLFTILMGVGFYFTTFMKNILRLPRPPSPPVTVLETTYDWSLPSLHAIIGVMLPWYICVYIYQHYQLLPVEIIIMVTLISFWSTSVSLSRVYLGVHSPADIVCGIVPGTIMLVIYLNIDDALDTFITTGSYIPLKSFLFYVFILGIHPNSGTPTHSYGETVICNSVAYGFIVGTTRTVTGGNYYSALMEQAEKAGIRTPPSAQLLMLGVARILIGFPLVLLTRVVMKALSKTLIRKVCAYFDIYSYSYSEYRKTTVQLNKHHTSGFILPPIWAKEKEEDDIHEDNHVSNGTCNGHSGNGSITNGNSINGNGSGTPHSSNGSTPVMTTPPDSLVNNGSMPLDIDNPTKFVTYVIMSWVATEWVHICFHQLGLHMLGR